MTDLLSGVAAILVTVPLIGYLAMFVLSKQLTKNHRRSVQRAIDFSTLLLILSVHFLVLTIWEKSFLWLILIILILHALIFTFIHWKFRQEIDFHRVFRGYWRVNFFLFFFAYIILIILGLYQRMNGLVAFL